VGANVKHFKPGDRVLALSNATYAELVAVDDSDVTHLPDGVGLADAAAIPLIALTGDQLVRLATNGAAACLVLEAASSPSVLKMLGWCISGRLERAKTLLASMVNGDLAAVNGISVALHHIVDGLHKMRQLAANPTLRSSMTVDAVVDECLFAPTTVVRQAKTSGEVSGWRLALRPWAGMGE
jgi:hypothetical protein